MTRSDRNAWGAVATVLTLCVVVAGALFLATEDAGAATWVNSCSTPPGSPEPGEITDDAIETRNQRIEDAANCAAIVERLEAVGAQLAQLDEDGTTTAQRVALAPRDRERLDLAWWGIWGIVGLMIVSLFATQWHRAFAFWRGNVLGRG